MNTEDIDMEKIKNKEELTKVILEKVRNQIIIDVKDNDQDIFVTSSKIGGKPSVPAGFEWPVFRYHEEDEEEEGIPLTFLCQYNLEELSQFDKEEILPKKGMLSFFYCVTDEVFFGYEPFEENAAKVFYFEDINSLVPDDAPEKYPDYEEVPEKAVSFKSSESLPTFEFLYDLCGGFHCDLYRDSIKDLKQDEVRRFEDCKLLGHADYVQHCVEYSCEKKHRGLYDLHISEEDEQAVTAELDNWVQLLQIDPDAKPFKVLFVDGFIHFCIRKDDLKALRFDQMQYILDCS